MNPMTEKNRKNAAHAAKVWLVKAAVFGVFAVLVLNPNPKRALLQLRHTFQPESLIQADLPSMPEINRAIETFQNEQDTELSEVRLVERFVRKRIRYATDYATWWNVEYWPTAGEVWQRQQEDCDGRAVLAVSILRSRGYRSAKLVVGLQHMWVQVNENEKSPGQPENVVGLLNPEQLVSLSIDGNPSANHYLSLAKSLFRPAALRDTSVSWMNDIPPARKTVLLLGFLFVSLYPFRWRKTAEVGCPSTAIRRN